ncbi:MAG: hypothetical protein CVT62_00955 [Actinobacteria bacterium HGW-Actinobacteria-2]|nr:MAG: hypothetical protein CVT62_00955 [Actinobacteria bacterium HGW-Actinobacteria-2]
MGANPNPARAWAITIALAVAVILAGCTPAAPSPSASPTAAPRPFTLLVTGTIGTLDPAFAVSRTDSILVTTVFQRLMQVLPNGNLKPDAAQDCVFTSRMVYECTLPAALKFTNGEPVTSADVKFSLQRALRLRVPGTSVHLLDSVSRIETPNLQTVRFVLSREDNQFGYALSSQAASIVNQHTFDPDAQLPLGTLPVGSGPLQLTTLTEHSADLTRYEDYTGPTRALLPAVRVSVAADSVAAEAAINAGEVDAAWACLDASAQARVDNEISAHGGTTEKGFTRIGLQGVKVTRLYWNPKSTFRSHKDVRAAVAKALQADRSLDSVVPIGVPDRVSAFPVGGRPKLPALKGARRNLSLGYDPADPTSADVARLLRDRLEDLDGVSVRLTTDPSADLLLTTAPGWINNALGWLQLYLGSPLGSSKVKLAELEAHARMTTGTARGADLSELQLQAATDLTVLPVSQGPEFLLVGPGYQMANGNFGSGEQLGLWGFTRG